MRTLWLILALALSVYAFYFCDDHTQNTPECLYEETKDPPTYSDGTPMEVGKNVCWDKRFADYIETETTEMQGIPVSIRRAPKVCRTVESIEYVGTTFRTCCDDYAKYVVQDEKKKNVRGISEDSIWLMSYKVCKNGEITACRAETKYKVTYSTKYKIAPSYSDPPKIVIRESASAFMAGDTVEMFRPNGTLRYRGFVKTTETHTLVTKGHCYNKSGTTPTRLTNDASLCK